MISLGIETSCDETAAAIVKDGNKIVSSSVFSQIKIHNKYGGVIPEIASRAHIEKIVSVVKDSISSSGLSLFEIDIISATQGPGLIGSLVVGFSFAKSLAYSLNLPFVGVNHLHAHIASVFFNSNIAFPAIALLVSGGHTNLYIVKDYTNFEIIGSTRDDAAGEAFDKVAKMLNLGYPGGVAIDDLAKRGKSNINFPRAFLKDAPLDFSFSGIKTAVKRYIDQNGAKNIEDILASFQEAVCDVLVSKTIYAANKHKVSNIAVVGGVAANSYLQKRFYDIAKEENKNIFIPPVNLCGDNGAMIACLAYFLFKNGQMTKYDEDSFSRAIIPTSIKHKGLAN